MARQGWNSTELFWEHHTNITEITFEDEINIPNGVTSWDVSTNQDSSVMAYIIDDELGTSTYHLYIQSNIKLYANPNSSYLFSNFTKLITINNLEMFTTSNVTNMESMFFWCTSLTNLDLNNFNTNSVTIMRSMFSYCYVLSSLDFRGFITSNVTDVSIMFKDYVGLTNLNLSAFDTSNVTNMMEMFSDCRSLTNLDIRNATFTSVTSYDYMFTSITSGINIIVKDIDAQTFINARLSDASRTGNVTIYVP